MKQGGTRGNRGNRGRIGTKGALENKGNSGIWERTEQGGTEEKGVTKGTREREEQKIIIIIIITYLTRINPSAEAVINGCLGN